MADPVELRKRHRILVAEDEYVTAADLADSLERLGIEVSGPVASVAEALTLLANIGDRLDAAVLDVNLGNERVYPVADLLRVRGIPFVFTTGYDASVIPAAYADVPRHEKPIDERTLARCITAMMTRN